MRKVSTNDLEPTYTVSDAVLRRLSDPLNTSDVAINHYTLEPSQRLAGLHTHMDQEEVFVVLEGEATFETLDGRVSVEAGEAIRFAPGKFHSGTNDSDSEVVILALGAPKGTEDWRVPVACSEWGHDDMRPTIGDDGETPLLVCPDCGAELEVACTECGSDEKRVILGNDGSTPIDVCLDCGAKSVAR